MSRSLGRLTLDLVARVGGFEQGMDRAQRKTRRASQQMSRDLEIARRAVGGLIGALSVGAVARFAQSQLQAADAINTAAQVANISTDSIQELRYAFGQLANVADREVDAALRRFNRRLGLARQESGAAQTAFEDMFGGADQFADTEQALDAVITSLAAMEDQSERAARASAFFGDDAGPALAAALGQGEAAVAALRQELQDMGGVLDGEVIDKASEATSELARTGRELRARLIPLVSVAAEGALFLADNMDTIATAAGVLGGVLATRLTASLITTSAQMAIGAVQNAAYQASLARTAGQAQATSVALAGLRGAMALLGGPAGVAIAAAGALGAWAISTRQGRVDTGDLREEVDRLTMSMGQLQARQLDQTIGRVNDQIEQQNDRLKDLNRDLQERREEVERRHGPDVEVDYSAFREEIAKTEAEIASLNEMVQELEERRKEVGKPIAGAGDGIPGAPDSADADKALEEYIEKLREEAAQLDINTQLDQTRYDIASGALGELTAAQEEQLESLADELDRKRELLEVEREREQQLERLRDQIEEGAEAARQADMDALERERERHELQMENLQFFLEKEMLLEEEYRDLEEQAYADHQHRLSEIHEEEAKRRAQAEQQVEQQIQNMRQQTYQMGVGLLQSFAGESQTAAYAAIALNAGLQAAMAIQNTANAEVRALAELGPIAGPPAAAKIKAYGAAQVALIGATGLMQASQVGSGGASLGSAGNPVATTPQPQAPALEQPQRPQTQELIVRLDRTRPIDQEELDMIFDGINERLADGAQFSNIRRS